MKSCPICNSILVPAVKPVPGEIKDHSISKETFQLTCCENCRLLHTNIAPDTNLADYYISEDYASHNLSYLNPVHLLYSIARTFTLKSKRRLLREISRGNRILDYGCGTGDFLSTMSKAGWITAGFEPSDNARKEAGKKNISKLWGEPKSISGSYDTITLWHVLEHTDNPKATISDLKERLAPGGTIIIALPNYKSPDAVIYGDYWAGYDVPRHLWHFSRESVSKLAASVGMKLSGTLPMKLDSYYVSLLSEKYLKSDKQSISTYFRALKRGFQSNKKAAATGQYSSLIYTLTE
jgi:2-polyprenyl-3-methyl-5-hydroxy-6-metoxy-1,4-benzoquinol methylase